MCWSTYSSPKGLLHAPDARLAVEQDEMAIRSPPPKWTVPVCNVHWAGPACDSCRATDPDTADAAAFQHFSPKAAAADDPERPVLPDIDLVRIANARQDIARLNDPRL